ncbi:uncharacterized protein E6C27_scaffold264G00950 [Cucumis melo var. makuwa]|uniref:RNA-directed DNA polymerase n=1 Tax=Cucumis melo var. makuwa TaxID=1194695 RepID=A0A5A7U2B8_CUCMM|nr:uncharacterized protein E6C27_scaffold264G00950 [Cucumis melo var. makuwa]
MEIVSCHTTSTTEEDAFPLNAMKETPRPEDVLPLGINDLLTLSREVKDTIIEILKNDDVSTTVTSPMKACDSCCMSISFSDEDLLLGSKLHNRPLYVSGYVQEQKFNQILIDNGSAVNILPKSTMNQLGISVEELSNSKLVIQGFNQGAQWAIALFVWRSSYLQASTIFHVIDSRTTYKMLLGRPWIHENGIVTSTLHQCFKFYKQGIRKVDADSRPFTKAKSHFADAKFYTKSENVSEIISTEVPVIKDTFKNEQEMITSKKSNKGNALNSQQNGESTTETKLRAPEAEKIATLQKEVSNSPVLRYIPLSRRKKGESPFAECSKNLTVKNTEILKENFTASLTKIEKGEAKKIKKKDLEAYLPERRTVEGFDPKAYKLMAKAGYDSTTRTELKSVKIFDERPELSPTQKKLQKQGYSIPNSRAGIGYQSSEPVRITDKGKIKRVSTSIAKDNNQVSTCSSTRLSAFQRLNTNAKKVQSISPTPTTRKSAFKRLSVSVTRGQKKASISVSNKSSLVTGDEEIRSAFPSRMKRKMFVSVNTEGSLKVMRHDVVFTRPEDNEPEDEVDVVGCCHVTIEETSEHDIFEEDAEAAPLSLEDGGQSTIDELKEVNLGTKEEPRPTFISTKLSDNDENEYVNLLKAYKDVFAWSYKKMPGLDPKVAVHRLVIKQEHRPVKQAQRRFRPELISQIEEEVNKLIEAGFIREVKYPTWIANIVLVRKKNGQLRVCVDFRNLNNACPKDDFPLPIMEIMIDATAGHEALSFTDGSSGYNQIRMALDDEEKTAFRTPKGIYCYKVMPFGLKNAGATYQRAMQRIFDDMLHKHIECYVDDLVVKSKKKCDHLKDLKLVLDRLRKYQLRMNLLKCAFGVTLGKFLGFIVRHRASKLITQKLMLSKRSMSTIPETNEEGCTGKSLILYIAAQETSLEALLAQENDKGKVCALYYLSRTPTGAELNYSPIEKMCLALFFAIDKLRHYMQAFTIHLVAKADPVKYILSRPVISGRLAKWAIILQQYDIVYIPQKAVKGQALADFLVDHPVPSNWKLCDDLPDEEVLFVESMEPLIMFFDGAARRSGAGVCIVFISPEKHMLPYSFTFGELCSNNVSEYQAFIIGLQMASEFGIKCIEIFGDSKLIINQLSYQYEVKHQDLKPYFSYARRLMDRFDSIILEHIPRSENKKADALANLATALTVSEDIPINIFLCQKWIVPSIESQYEEADVISVYAIDEEDWRQPIIDYLKHGKLPTNPRHRAEIRRRAARFIYYKDTLYRRSYEGLLLRCLGKEESTKALEEAHSGICGAHQSGPKLQYQLKRMGYYLPTMIHDSMHFAKYCEASWGLDLVGPITPKSSVGTDYFSKWAKVVPLREAKKENIVNFVQTHIIYIYGIPHRIVTDNGRQFANTLMEKLCEKFNFKQYKSSMYNAAANGLAEAFNKTLCSLLKKVVSKTKRDWQEKIGEALWAYRTTHRTPTGVTPYSLVYGVEVVLPLEREIPSLRMAIQEGLTTEDNARLRLQELEALDEKRLEAQQALECYQARMSKAFDKQVKPRSFQVGDLVLAVRRPIITTRHTGNKFTPKWDGPYIVKEVFTNGAYKIIDQDGLRIGPINGKFLKKFYA